MKVNKLCQESGLAAVASFNLFNIFLFICPEDWVNEEEQLQNKISATD